MIKSNLNIKKRIKFEFLLFIIGFIIILIKLFYSQIIKGKEYATLAKEQLNTSRSINAQRGNIYDSTKQNILAESITVYTVTLNPVKISEENKEKVAKILTEIFSLDYEKTLDKTKQNVAVVNIAKKVEKEKTDKLREWMNNENIIDGINIDEDTKRYYPYSNLASHIIGFCGSDNQGLDGIEAKYDEILSGKKGKVSEEADAKGQKIGNNGEKYESPIDGNSIVLTIDMTIQAIVEKYIEEACIDNICTDGASIIMMNPQNGDILAMANYPDYNLNSPYEITREDLKEIWDNLNQEDKSKYLQEMWRNKAISNTYEPGSTFKLVTASAALEEGIVSDIDKQGSFSCSGGIEIAGIRIKCWRYYRPHGGQSLRLALMNSCNPVFISLGQKIGVSKYYEYLEKFGFLRKTGIDTYGEAKSIFLKEEKVGPIELATISFGQRFEVTPLQMITMVSSIANNGVYIQPRLVKEIIDATTGESEVIESVYGNRIISEETSQKILSMMESVVSEGTGKNASVEGYRIGGKTGTSEDGVNTGKYVTSFIGIAPIEKPEVAMLITLYNPTGEGGHQGGGVAAPIASQILSEVLPYLEIKNSKEKVECEIPNIIGKTFEEAKEILKENYLECVLYEEEKMDKNSVIKWQMPEGGIKVYEGSIVYIK